MTYTDGKHLVADTIDELHAFALRLGLKREWFQNHLKHPHYDLFGSKVTKARTLGACKISSKDIVHLFNTGILETRKGLSVSKNGNIISNTTKEANSQ